MGSNRFPYEDYEFIVVYGDDVSPSRKQFDSPNIQFVVDEHELNELRSFLKNKRGLRVYRMVNVEEHGL